jgi:membrane protein YdbS with pleckstrin-like domain
MTAHAHRAPFRPFDRHSPHDPHPTARVADRAPEVLLALSAVLVVLAGPVARSFAPDNGWVAVGSALLLAVGLVLAVVATRHLLRPPPA